MSRGVARAELERVGAAIAARHDREVGGEQRRMAEAVAGLDIALAILAELRAELEPLRADALVVLAAADAGAAESGEVRCARAVLMVLERLGEEDKS